jgi:CDP-diacylglycerol--serine O-phosphatidyltransferase
MMEADGARQTRRARARAIVEARLEKLEEISIAKLVPSFLTLLGLCSGVTAMRYAVAGEWTNAVAAVVCAMIFDMLDGRAARILGADSRFGAQLDSLADLVSFGVAPALIMYGWSLRSMNDLGWLAALVFCAASAVRLARFNVQAARDEGATNVRPYFTGLPTPAAAGMVLLPLLVSFQWNNELVQRPGISVVFLVVTSLLMVSNLPTPSIKYMKLQRQHRVLAALFFAGLGTLLILWPWATLTGVLLIYVVSIPFAILGAKQKHTP